MPYTTPGLLTDSDRWLAKLVRLQRMAIHTAALAGGGVAYDTVTNATLTTSGTVTYGANTIHSISFTVIQGTLTVSFDGGSTSVIYPAGTSVQIGATTTFSHPIILTVSSTSGDNSIVQTVS